MKIAIATIVLGIGLMIGGTVGHNVNVYRGTNVGVTWGSVGGCEIVGNIGCWLGEEG